MKTLVSNEDERIKRAVEEAEAKQAKEDAERTERALRMTREADQHRLQMVCEYNPSMYWQLDILYIIMHQNFNQLYSQCLVYLCKVVE